MFQIKNVFFVCLFFCLPCSQELPCVFACRFLECPGSLGIRWTQLLCLLMDSYLPQLLQTRPAATKAVQVLKKYFYFKQISILLILKCFCCCFSFRDKHNRDFLLDYGVALLNGAMATLTAIWSLTWLDPMFASISERCPLYSFQQWTIPFENIGRIFLFFFPPHPCQNFNTKSKQRWIWYRSHTSFQHKVTFFLSYVAEDIQNLYTHFEICILMIEKTQQIQRQCWGAIKWHLIVTQVSKKIMLTSFQNSVFKSS